MLAIVPILASSGALARSDSTIKYFVSQRAASVLYLASYFLSVRYPDAGGLISAALLFKLGLPPVHRWLVSVLLSARYTVVFLLLIVQKFIPLHVLSNLQVSISVLALALTLSIFLSLLILRSLRRLRVVLIISAWTNTRWLALTTQRAKAWAVYLTLYGLFLGSLLGVLGSARLNKLPSVVSASTPVKFSCSLSFLNLGGLPPFSGFFVKLLLLKYIRQSRALPLVLVLLALSLISLYAYLASSFYVLTRPVGLSSQIKPNNSLSGCVGVGVTRLAFPVFAIARM